MSEENAHSCELKNDCDSGLPRLRPGASAFEKWKRKFQKQLLVSPDHPECQFYFKSNAAINSEKRRHMREWPYSIHPFSKVALYREFVMSPVWFFEFFSSPVFYAYYTPLVFGIDVWHNIDLISEICLLINVIVCFFLGVVEKQNNRVELALKKIAKNYLFTYFMFDFIDTLPFTLLMLPYYVENYPTPYFIHVFRFARLSSAIAYFRRITAKCGIGNVGHELICLAITYFLCVHWCACYIYLLPKALTVYLNYPLDKSLWLHRNNISLHSTTVYSARAYLLTLRVALCHFVGAPIADVTANEPLDYICFSFVLITGFFFSAYVTAKIFLIVKSTYTSETEYDELVHQFFEYGNKKGISFDMKKRIVNYLEHNYQGKFFKEKIIISTLSEHFKAELFLYDCKRIVEKVQMFEAFSRSTVGLLISFLRREVFLENDVVLRVGPQWDTVRFISYGTAAFVLKNGFEVFHYHDGDCIGLVGLIANIDNYVGSVIALEICEMYRIDKMDLEYCIAQDAEIYSVLYASAKEKQKRVLDILHSSRHKVEKSVSHQLRKGLILEGDVSASRLKPYSNSF